jgi:hypothetical protein
MKTSEFFEKIPAYLDGSLSGKIQQDFEEMLQQNPSLKTQVEEFQAMEQMLSAEKIQHPSQNFTQRVMANLYRTPAQNRSSIVNGLFLIGGVLVLAGLFTILSYAGLFDSAETQIDLNHISILHKYVNKSLPAIPFNGKLIVNIIIFMNLLLALIVLDRAILKPFFQRRIEAGS